MKKFIVVLMVCVGLSVLAGCAVNSPDAKFIPLPGDNAKKIVTAWPSIPIIMALDFGDLLIKPIKNNQGRIGFEVTKKHFLVGKTGSAKAWLPIGASRMGTNAKKAWLGVTYLASYDLDGKRYLNQYNISSHPDKDKHCKLEARFVQNPQTMEFVLIED